MQAESCFHLHLVSDSTGETLQTVARAVLAQYKGTRLREHVHPLIRSRGQLEHVINSIKETPGIVLFTLLEEAHKTSLQTVCHEIGVPAVDVLAPVFSAFQNFLHLQESQRVGGQHSLDATYFKRIEALNYTMLHDDGQMSETLSEADVILVGISRTSKTPTSIYMANRGIKTANVPLIPDIPIPDTLLKVSKPLIVGLYASVNHVIQIRHNRLRSLKADERACEYVDRRAVAREVSFMRRLCAQHGWPIIDVTRRSIEETAVEITSLYRRLRDKG